MTVTDNGDEVQRQQRIAQAVVRYDCGSLNVELRHWEEAKLLFTASVVLTAIYLFGISHTADLEWQKVRIFLFAIAATFSFVSAARALRSFGAVFASARELIVLLVAVLWGVMHGFIVAFFILQRLANI